MVKICLNPTISTVSTTVLFKSKYAVCKHKYAGFDCSHKDAICTVLLTPGVLSLFGAIAFVRIGEIN